MGELLCVSPGESVSPGFGEFFAPLFVVGALASCGGYALLHEVFDVHRFPGSGRGLGRMGWRAYGIP
ncbi:hypothetical protein A6E92_22180 [Streptomyces sp. S8]|nr:hypothetical protein A6E92_22180 [Streptomyces sp. S8]